MIDEIIKFQTDAKTNCVYPYPSDILSPVSVLLKVLKSISPKPLDLAMSWGNKPEFFIIEASEKDVINFDVNYLVLSYNLISAFHRQNVDDQIVAKQVDVMILKFVKAFFPSTFLNASRHAKFQKAMDEMLATASRNTVRVAWFDHAAIDTMDFSEFYFVLWFFHAAHEFGHHLVGAGQVECLGLGELKEIMAFSPEHVMGFIEKQKQQLNPDEGEFYFSPQVEKLGTGCANAKRLANEMLCDQVGVLITLKAIEEVRRAGFHECGDVQFLFDSFFKVFGAHLQVSAACNLPNAIGFHGKEGALESERRREENSVRLQALRDFCAFLLPVLGDYQNFSSLERFSTFGYYGSMGVREMAQVEIMNVNFVFEPSIDAVSQTLLKAIEGTADA